MLESWDIRTRFYTISRKEEELRMEMFKNFDLLSFRLAKFPHFFVLQELEFYQFLMH